MTALRAAPAMPSRSGSRYRFESAGRVLEIDASLGARVVELSLSGHNVLTGPSVHPENHGSTFWISPQSQWCWPPPAEIDRNPYRGGAVGDAVVLEGEPNIALGLGVKKTFRMGSDGVVTIDYAIRNSGVAAVRVAAWEVTRVGRSGVTFFPLGKGVYSGCGLPAPEFTERGGLVWVDHACACSEDRKLYADGARGWLAHATRGLLLLKRFADVPHGSQAPGEAEIEIFVNGDPAYVEIEQQGALTEIAVGAEHGWRVEWQLLRLPDQVPSTAGHPALLDAVNTVVNTTGALRGRPCRQQSDRRSSSR